MSMRLEYRWIDYLMIFNDSSYIYYYEFLDNLSRMQILAIEEKIIQIHIHNRNDFFQTEYFYCENYDEFHNTIICVLNKMKINYNVHNIHNFDRKYYDNKPDTFEPNLKHRQIQIINNGFTPYYYQQEILDIIENFYAKNDIGIILWACGLGKALLGILIVQKLKCNLLIKNHLIVNL
jgi:hypothetical protein